MKIWLKMIIAIVVGLAAGLFIPDNIKAVEKIFEIVSSMSINILLYFTVVYIAVKTYLGVVELKNSKKSYLKTMLVFLLSILLSLVLASIISIGVMNFELFHPGSRSIPQASSVALESFTFIGLLYEIINSNLLTAFEGPVKFILPLIFLATLFGFASFYTRKQALYFVEVIESLDAILDTILTHLMDFFYLGAIFITANLFYGLKVELFSRESLPMLISPLLAIFSVTIILLIFYTIFLFIIFRKNLWKNYLGILGAALTGLITGNSAASIIPLNEHLEKNLGVKRGTAGSLTALGMVLNKTGTIVAATVVLFSSILIYSPNNLSLDLQLNLFLLIILFSFRLDGINEAGFLVLISMILKVESLHLEENSYLLFLIFVPIISRIALFLDIMTTGLFIVVSARYSDNIDEKAEPLRI